MRVYIISFFSISFFLSGCTNIFLQPDHVRHYDPTQVGLNCDLVHFKASDGTQLTGLWFASAKSPAKGVVVQFHGNGENMTSHFLFVYWLALEGWHVFSFDYRGYGVSSGSKSLEGSVEDGVAALEFASSKAPGLPVVVIGQSLGGALSVASISYTQNPNIYALVLDSTFASYQRVAQNKLSQLWLTWPLQWLLSRLLISDRFAAENLIVASSKYPKLFFHSKDDPVVPYVEGMKLYNAATGEKHFIDVEGSGHTEALSVKGSKYRPILSQFLNESIKQRVK